MLNKVVVTPAGFEPATCPLGGGCSIQLSHGAIFGLVNAGLPPCHDHVCPWRCLCLELLASRVEQG